MKIEKSTQFVGKWIASAKIKGVSFHGYGEKLEAIDQCFAKINWYLYGTK